MKDHSEVGLRGAMASVEKWVDDVSAYVWDRRSSTELSTGEIVVGVVGAAAAVAAGIALARIPGARAIKAATEAVSVPAVATKLALPAPRALAGVQENIFLRSLDQKVLHSAEIRSRMDTKYYLDWLQQNARLSKADMHTYTGFRDGSNLVVREDIGVSVRENKNLLEIIDHEAQTARLYVSDPRYGTARITITPRLQEAGAAPPASRVEFELLKGQHERTLNKEQWLHTSATGTRITPYLFHGRSGSASGV